MDISFEKGVSEDNGNLLSAWSNEKGEKFQEQWMGPEIPYPLNFNKLKDLENIYSVIIDKEFLGVIQQMRIEDGDIHVGRFVINPNKTGLGYGKKALSEFISYCFAGRGVSSVSLTVFDCNKNAKVLYEKLGFEIVETIKQPELKYIMKKTKEKASINIKGA